MGIRASFETVPTHDSTVDATSAQAYRAATLSPITYVPLGESTVIDGAVSRTMAGLLVRVVQSATLQTAVRRPAISWREGLSLDEADLFFGGAGSREPMCWVWSVGRSALSRHAAAACEEWVTADVHRNRLIK